MMGDVRARLRPLNRLVESAYGKKIIGWVAFGVMLAWSWRIDLWGEVPAYGDVFEAFLGMLWYRDAFQSETLSAAVYPLIFYPEGLQTGTLAHRPLQFLLYQPLLAFGGSAPFAYNSFLLLTIVIAFSGAKRLFNLYTGQWLGLVAALIYTFTFARFDRINGHANIFAATAVLPWFLYQVELLRQDWELGQHHWLRLVWVGLLWGLMLNLMLYALFWGALGLLLLGRSLFQPSRWRHLVVIGILTILFSLPSVVPYYLGQQISQGESASIDGLANYGLSVNNLISPGLQHSVLPLRSWAERLYSGRFDETATLHVGLSTVLLALWGGYKMQGEQQKRGRLWLVIVGFVLSLGIVLRWNGEVVTATMFAPLTEGVWRMGHWVNPSVFTTTLPPDRLAQSIPMPGMLLLMFVPYWSAARVTARFAMLVLIIAIGLAASGLRHFSRPWQVLLIMIWMVEMWPVPSHGMSYSMEMIHPAYQWLAEQPVIEGEAIFDIDQQSSRFEPEILWATYLHQTPSVSITNPSITVRSANFLSLIKSPFTNEQTQLAFKDVGIRYLFLHRQNEVATGRVWEAMLSNGAYKEVGCFAAGDQPIWPYEICVAELLTNSNLLKESGWTAAEPWGQWGIGAASTGRWVATNPDAYGLTIEAFPHCIDGQKQTISLSVNDQLFETYDWEACETWSAELEIPAELVQHGVNTLRFEYGYNVSPLEVTAGENADNRPLAVGFSRLALRSAIRD